MRPPLKREPTLLRSTASAPRTAQSGLDPPTGAPLQLASEVGNPTSIAARSALAVLFLASKRTGGARLDTAWLQVASSDHRTSSERKERAR